MIWMYGVLAWEIFTFGTRPWNDVADEEVTAKVRKGNTLERPIGCPEVVFQVMVGCWDLEPDERPAAERILEILDTVDTSALEQMYLNKMLPPTFLEHPISETAESTQHGVYRQLSHLAQHCG